MKVHIAHISIKNKLFNFYVKYSEPKYEPWSLKRIAGLNVRKPIDVEGFTNTSFKAFRGQYHKVHKFSLAGIPFMSP